jgi:anti-sigma factor (TIGR02949 family)
MSDSIDCREAELRLYDYLKREVTPELEEEMRSHLARCRPCFSQARFEENFLRLLESCADRVRCPGTLRARIVALLQVEAERD